MPTLITEHEDRITGSGRKQTDDSLGAEREKTDVSLKDGRKKEKHRTDQALSNKRAEIDAQRNQERYALDELNVGSMNSINNMSSHDLDLIENIEEERLSADKTLAEERRHLDALIARERKENRNDERNRFQDERKKTDSALNNERTQTDSKIKISASALTTRDEFLAIVSHDLRNPLGTISMGIDMLKNLRSYDQLDQEAQNCIGIIERNASYALRLIDDLSDSEQFATGKLRLNLESNDLHQIIEQSIQSLKGQAMFKHLTLECYLPFNNIIAICDHGRISQVLSNLIGNAIKFTPENGSIIVTAKFRPNEIEVSVSDNGPGIPNDKLEKVFERFWQIGKDDRRGLGLGLYISRMIIEAHGGHLTVHSELEKGSTFTFNIPTT